MSPLNVQRISKAVWRWFCRCPEMIGPGEEDPSDDEFYTPPTSPPNASADISNNANTSNTDVVFSTTHLPCLLTPTQMHRLRCKHANAVHGLITSPPIVESPPPQRLKPYQRPIKVFRPSWAPPPLWVLELYGRFMNEHILSLNFLYSLHNISHLMLSKFFLVLHCYVPLRCHNV